ncbi:MAG: ABC transporter ATP-binding protein [Nevskiales bacterium]
MTVPAIATASALLTVRQLRVYFPPLSRFGRTRSGPVKAVDGIQLDLNAGETLGIVGESGCGKSTLARALVGLQPVTAGAVLLDGQDITRFGEQGWRQLRRQMQMVFQDPLASLNPRLTIGQNIAEPLINLFPELDAAQKWERVLEILPKVGLKPEHANRYPHEFSGGQNQRTGIARALVVRPRVLVCDEAVSALDVTVQAQIVELLMQLQREMNLAMIFIAHDLSVVRKISHRVLVMYLGKIMEQAPTAQLFREPRHPYTRALLAAVPIPDPRAERAREKIILEGELPSPADPPEGCVFRTRCPIADNICGQQIPGLRKLSGGSYAACHFVAG